MEYPSRDRQYIKMYNKNYQNILKLQDNYTPLITGSPEYNKEYYEFNKDRIAYYNYCKENNIPYKKRGRPPHWRVEKNKGETLKINKGKFIITF